MRILFFLIILTSTLFSCDDSEDFKGMISGKVVDAYTKIPLANVEVTLLEGGPTMLTDAEGNFAFSDAEVSSLDMSDKVIINGEEGVALSFKLQGYRFREANAVNRSKGQFEITPLNVPVYFYHKPVQLNDGLSTASLDEINMDRQIIQNLMDRLYTDKYREIHSVLVYKDDKLVLEEYFPGNNDTIQFENNIAVDRTPDSIQWTRTDPHYVASVNKALTSTVVGIALDKFGLSVGSKIADYLPAYAQYFSDPNKSEIDFEDCLTMTASFQWDEWGSNDLALMWKSDDLAEFVLSRNNFGPGTEWRYNSALPNLLLKTIDDMSGGNVRAWAMENFYHKLGITDLDWQSQPDGYPEGAARMFIRPRDMLKIGVTYLNNGMWNGEQVIPETWVAACLDVKEQTTSGDYSYYFWLRNLDGVSYLSADGDGGNFINIFPDQNMVIVITQGNYLLWPFYVNQADDIMKNYIFPAIQ